MAHSLFSCNPVLNTLPPKMNYTILPQTNIEDLPKILEPASQ